MDPFDLPPIAALLSLAYAGVQSLATLLTPLAGAASAALAIVAVTLLVRAVLVPVGVSQAKAEWARRRLAPKLAAIQRRYRSNPRVLREKTMALYRDEGVSPLAGVGPALAQTPVITIIYALFIRTTVDGRPNGLLAEQLGGVPLGSSFAHVVALGGSGVLVFVALFSVIAVVAWFTRRSTLRHHLRSPDATPTAVAAERYLSWLPFLTLVFAAIVPLAATIYLATTTAWSLVERFVLRRMLWR